VTETKNARSRGHFFMLSGLRRLLAAGNEQRIDNK
jgi:hypothetical protein